MKKLFRDISLLVVIPLVLVSVSLAVIGPAHPIKFTHVNRILKIRESENSLINCNDDLCGDLKDLEDLPIQHV